MTRDEWGNVKQRLLKTVGQNNYTTWIDPLVLGPLDSGIATVHVPTTFFGNYVSQNFADLILHEMKAFDGSLARLNFEVAEKASFTSIKSKKSNDTFNFFIASVEVQPL